MRPILPLLLVFSTISCTSAKLVGRDAVEVAKAPAREWKTTAAVAGAVAATLLVDDEVAALARRNQPSTLSRTFDAVEPLGGGASDKVMAAFFLYGAVAKQERERQVAFDAFVSSMIASKAITPALKAAFDRERPNGGDPDSFPSNHATQAFAVATVIATHYEERRWVRWLAYGLAGGVGLARVYNDAHYLSDVVAGAAIGTFVGHTVVRTNERERSKWALVPVIEHERVGFVVTLSR